MSLFFMPQSYIQVWRQDVKDKLNMVNEKLISCLIVKALYIFVP